MAWTVSHSFADPYSWLDGATIDRINEFDGSDILNKIYALTIMRLDGNVIHNDLQGNGAIGIIAVANVLPTQQSYYIWTNGERWAEVAMVINDGPCIEFNPCPNAKRYLPEIKLGKGDRKRIAETIKKLLDNICKT